jgi:hypothetical protein
MIKSGLVLKNLFVVVLAFGMYGLMPLILKDDVGSHSKQPKSGKQLHSYLIM